MRKILVFLLFFMLFSTSFAEEEKTEAEDDTVYETAYFKIEPDIVSNVKGKAKYIRTSIQLQTNRADLLYEIETHAAYIRHILLMNIVDQDGGSIKQNDGKESLRKELLSAVSSGLDEKAEHKGIITDLFFTTYYVK